MNAIDLLEQQHRDVEELFGMIEKADGAQEKRRLFDDLADSLAIHATIEEKLFYRAAKRPDTEDVLRESVEEHLSVKRLIADLMDTAASDPQLDAKILVLKEQVEHHVREERNELFPKTRKRKDLDLDDLGGADGGPDRGAHVPRQRSRGRAEGDGRAGAAGVRREAS